MVTKTQQWCCDSSRKFCNDVPLSNKRRKQPDKSGSVYKDNFRSHQRLQDSSGIVQNQDNDGGGNQYIEGYDLSPTELIDLPNGIFNKLNNDFYLNYVRPFVPQRYQDSKYGYR